MTYLDGLLIVIGISGVLWGTLRQTVGMLLSWLGLFLSVTAAGMVVLFLSGTYGFGANLIRSLWGSATSFRLVEAVVFVALFLGVLAVYEVGIRIVYPNPSLSKLGVWDNVIGGVLGVVFGLVLMAMFSNAWRVAMTTPWQPFDTWAKMSAAYSGSFLAPYMIRVLRVFRDILLPFYFLGFPSVLVA